MFNYSSKLFKHCWDQYYNELQLLILGLGSVLVFESSVLLRSPDLLYQSVSSGV